MVHLGGTNSARMLDVTSATFFAGRMKSGRLLAQIGGGRRMAGDAGGRLDAFCWRMARLAFLGQKRMLFRKRTRDDGICPAGNRQGTVAVQADRYRRYACDGERYKGHIDERAYAHVSHRSP